MGTQLRLSSTRTSSQQPSFLVRNRRAVIWSTLSLAIGGILGTLVTHTIAPPPHPEPNTPGDKLLLHDLNTRIDEEFKVKVLRGKCTAAAANLRGDQAAWRELDSRAAADLTGRALGGARGLGVQRVFWNDRERELVAVVWFGGALAGWPGVTHGGAIATVMSEKAALAASLARSGASGEELSALVPALDVEPNQLQFTYKKPTYANAFYLVRMHPRDAVTAGLATMVKSLGQEMEVEGKLETLDGTVCVQMTSVVPAAASQTSGVEVAEPASKARSWTSWLP